MKKDARQRQPDPIESIEQVAAVLTSFDYAVDPDDFVVHQLGRLIEEDRASFDDEEFRRLIDEGIREHVGGDIETRAALAGILRRSMPSMEAGAATMARRVIGALEDATTDLSNVVVVVRSYTAHLFQKLESLDDSREAENKAADCIVRSRNGELTAEGLVAELVRIGPTAVGPTADLLLDNPEDRTIVEIAIAVLEAMHSPASARVLAHLVSEPMLPEDLESRAFMALRANWPLPRHYMLYTLRSHTHEDLPYRWFQLFVEMNELETVDLVLDELRAHGESPAYREDLIALVELLPASRDPEAENKVLAFVNQEDSPQAASTMLEQFLKEYRPLAPPEQQNNPWAREKQLADLNEKYLAAAKLGDSGRTDEALTRLNEILTIDPDYAFARMLKKVVAAD